MISLDEQNGIEKAFYLTYHAGAKWVYRLFESGVPTEVQQGLSLMYLEYENMRIAIEHLGTPSTDEGCSQVVAKERRYVFARWRCSRARNNTGGSRGGSAEIATPQMIQTRHGR